MRLNCKRGELQVTLRNKHLHSTRGVGVGVIPVLYGLDVLDINLFKKVSNHPVHILNSNGNFSPSAFIPFCSFGEDILGVKVKEFDIPVCSIFKPKLQYTINFAMK